MKKAILALAMAMVLALPLGAQAADTQAQSADAVLTGTQWLKATDDEKYAFLYGVTSAFEVEEYFATKGKKGKVVPSHFAKNWLKVAKELKEGDAVTILKEIEAWYKANGDKMDTPVLVVIWTECVQPRLKKAGK